VSEGLVLHDNRDSTNALKVRFLLAELGEQARIVDVELDGDRGPDYAGVHPFGLIPALTDGDLTITESNTALRYLAERAGRDDLRGADPRTRARVDVLLDSLSLEVRPALWGLEEIEKYGLDADDAEHARRRAACEAALAAYDRLLDGDGPYALGAFTIADCAIAGRLLHVPKLSLDATRFPRTTRALHAAMARPAFAAAR